MDLLRRCGPLATVEVAEVCDWMEDLATARLLEMERAGEVAKTERCGGLFWSAR